MTFSEMIIWTLLATAALVAANFLTKKVYHAVLRRAYFEGWTAAANWAGRTDLHADVHSPAYEHERDLRLKIK